MAKAAKPRTTAREVHVLLADPGEKVTVILETALRQEGYKTHVARDSRVAYLKTLQLRPDAVIADLALPPEGAARLTATLRTNAVGRKSPVLIKGAPERPEVQDALRELGAAAVLSRPLRYGDLCKQLHAALRSAGKKPPGEKEAEAAGEAGAAPAGEPPEDEAVLRDPKALPSDKLQRVLDRASKLAAFPFVIARALAITEDDRSGAKDLAECVRSDPGLAGSILKIANTVHFASRGRSITDVGEAIVRVGFRETKRLVLAMPLLEMFPKEARNRAFDRVDFWLHSLAVGCIANQLARRSQYPHPEEAFITGLLHDVGKLVLDECFPRVFEEVLEKTLQGEGQTLEAERAIIGVGHPQIGAALMGRWNLPRSLQDALNLHHDLGRAKEGVGGTSLALVRIIALSDQIAKAVGVGGAGDRYLMEPDPSTWRAASLPTGLDTEGLKDVFRELNLFREFLNLGTTEIAPVRDTPARREGFILHVDERRRDASLLRLVLDSLGYQLLPLERRGETPARLVLVEATGGPERLAEYQALAEGAPGAPRLPLVIVSEDPYEVTEDARAHTASLGAAHDARTLERTLDGLILGENVQRAPAIDPEYLRSEEEALRGELASRLRAGPA
ncbi:MAG: HDOD domain-containing protein, partial [Planctomycetes bacterium]|nr:HDOD domain-containing protein [Planctomycetota bacterium]